MSLTDDSFPYFVSSLKISLVWCLYLKVVLNCAILLCSVLASTENFTNISFLLFEFPPLRQGFYGLLICYKWWPVLILLMPVRNGDSKRELFLWWFGIAFSSSVQCLWIILLHLFIICNSYLLYLLTNDMCVVMFCSTHSFTCFSLNKPIAGGFNYKGGKTRRILT